MTMRQLTILSLAAFLLAVACVDQSHDAAPPFERLPQLLGTHSLTHGDVAISPARIEIVGDTLFISSSQYPRIDKYDYDLNMIGSTALTYPKPVYPTDFKVTDSLLIVADHSNSLIVLYNRKGELVTSFGSMPNTSLPLSPFALDFYGGVAYVGDARLRLVLAVSMVDADGITEIGELILTIPADSVHSIGFPSAIMVTDDGRLLIGDALNGLTKVFTCDGRFVYTFDTVATANTIAPQGLAVDNVIDPSIQDSTSFDPSGVRFMGRIHIVDANNRQVHMFNPLGRYVASYTTPDSTGRPSDIAIDRQQRLIYVTDPVARRLFVYSYRSDQ